MTELLKLILALGLAVVTNIALGMWYNIGKKNMKFDWKIFLNGIIKGAIIGGSFISLSYVLELSNITTEEVPIVILLGGITIYFGMCVTKLKDILGITKKA